MIGLPILIGTLAFPWLYGQSLRVHDASNLHFG